MGQLPFEKKRTLLVKREEDILEDFGCLPYKRPIEEYLNKGIINLNKPPGPTSHQVSEWVKQILNVKKAGHSGTLDPKVSGVLPVGINEGTKVLQTLLVAGKEYVALMHLHEKVPSEKIKEALNDFSGKIFQRPPLIAAVKRLLRVREIYYNELLEINEKDVLFKVGCEAGTYIRRFCHDIGLVLGTGAHMQQLIRTKTGQFNINDSVLLQDVVDAYHFWKEDGDEKELRRVVQPMEIALVHLPKIIISDYAINSVCHGAQLAAPGVLKVETGITPGDLVAVFSQKGEAVFYGRALMGSNEILKAKKGFVLKTKRVLMEQNRYPKRT